MAVLGLVYLLELLSLWLCSCGVFVFGLPGMSPCPASGHESYFVYVVVLIPHVSVELPGLYFSRARDPFVTPPELESLESLVIVMMHMWVYMYMSFQLHVNDIYMSSYSSSLPSGAESVSWPCHL
jgi:hypothetical protein